MATGSGAFGGIFYEVGVSNRGSPLWNRKPAGKQVCTFGSRAALKGTYWGKEWADSGKGQYGELMYDVKTVAKGEPLFLKASEENPKSPLGLSLSSTDTPKRSRRASISEGFSLNSAVEGGGPHGRSRRRDSMLEMSVERRELFGPRVSASAPVSYLGTPLNSTPASAAASSAASLHSASGNPSASPSATPSASASLTPSRGPASRQASHPPSRVGSAPPSQTSSRSPSRVHSRRPSSDLTAAILELSNGRTPFMVPFSADSSPVPELRTSAPPSVPRRPSSRPTHQSADTPSRPSSRPSSAHPPYSSSRPRSSPPSSHFAGHGHVFADSSSTTSSSSARPHRNRTGTAAKVSPEFLNPASKLEAILQQALGSGAISSEPGPWLGPCHVLQLHVEHCEAARPSSTLRGSKAKYLETFYALKLAVERIAREAQLTVTANTKSTPPRIGAFEVSFTLADETTGARHGPFPLFSKLATGTWPSSSRLASQLEKAVAALLKHAR